MLPISIILYRVNNFLETTHTDNKKDPVLKTIKYNIKSMF